jgi:hypothetical protein
MIKDSTEFLEKILEGLSQAGRKAYHISDPTETTDSSDTTNFVVQFIPRKPKNTKGEAR